MNATQHARPTASTKAIVIVKKRPKPPAKPQAAPQKPQPTPEEKAARLAAHEAKMRTLSFEAEMRRRERTAQIIAAMRATWPALFGEGTLIRPLKKGIGPEIAAGLPQFSKKAVRTALTYFLNEPTVRAGYLLSLIEGGPRYDLSGKPTTEVVTFDEQEQAAQQLQALEQRFPFLTRE